MKSAKSDYTQKNRNMFFDVVREELLNEAKASPNLLSDLAGLEGYIAESYHNRSFIELLQNADDAEASKFKIFKSDDYLFVANDGKLFNQKDLESLCRSASSNKLRGKTIGYRGIGFKSVVGFASEIHIISGDLQFTFSKTKSLDEIKGVDRVPLIRIPHHLSEEDRNLIEPVYKILQTEGYSTIFVFGGVTASEIQSEFESFEYNSLLFIRNITKTDISISKPTVTTVQKNRLSSFVTETILTSNGQQTKWIISQYKHSSIAFLLEDEKLIKLPSQKALVHSFLPTEDSSGLGVLLNGNFSTDPSRRHVIFDEETNKAIQLCSEHLHILYKDIFFSKDSASTAYGNALTPLSDPRMLQFKKNSFDKLLFDQVKSDADDNLIGLKICPNWLNSKDFKNIFSEPDKSTINPDLTDIEGFTSFAKYLGAAEVGFEELIPFVNDSEISILGCVQFTKVIFGSLLSFKPLSETIISNLRILHSDGKRFSLNTLKEDKLKLDDSFIQLLLENGLTESDIRQVLKKYSAELIIDLTQDSELDNGNNPVIASSKSNVTQWFNNVKETKQEKIVTGIRRWRSAEEQTLEILNLNGFNLEDVSKQNVGYDIAGFDPNGNEIQIEVKSITLPGQKFKLTNNEVAVAQEKRESFYVAVVRQLDDKFEIALIPDPANNLTLNRQCVQWIWECENYEYSPRTFEL